MTRIAFILLFYSPLLFGQSYHVPSRIHFAGIELSLAESLQKELQAEVDALVRSRSYLNIKLDRAKLYFPIIERIFREENLPDDFKYLVIQESALIPDAVSTSNAVGFWQFKKEAATEVGLRLDGGVDERLNIVSSTRGAARYLKKNNAFYDNWLYALLAYNTGRGGAEQFVDPKFFGAKRMHVDKRLHWYVKKFLAHKIAFESALADYPDPERYLYEYKYASNKSIREIALDFSVDEEEVFSYNKWLKRERTPMDKEYTFIIPLKGSSPATLVSSRETEKEKTPPRHKHEFAIDESAKYPEIEEFEGFDAYRVKINGRQGVVAKKDHDNIQSLSLIANISVEKFLKYNDLESGQEVVAGYAYYAQPKRNKAKTHYHVLQPGEDLWSVSQKYGIKLEKLKQKNRITNDEPVKPGRVLWMRFIRPPSHPVEYKAVNAVAAEEKAKGKAIADRAEPAETVPAPLVREEMAPIVRPEIKEQAEEEKDSLVTHPVAVNETQAEVIPVMNADESTLHVVKQGETLYSISKLYDVAVGQIQLWNNLDESAEIRIGQELIIKNTAAEAPEQQRLTQNNPKTYIYHKVASGETLYKIARRYNVTIQQLMEWNGKTGFNVQIGESLRVSE